MGSSTVETVELERQLCELRLLIDSTPDRVARLDARGRFLFVNRAMEAALGGPERTIIGKTARELGAPPETEAAFERTCRHAVAERKPASFDMAYGGGIFHVQLVPGFNAAGNLSSVMIFARDITDLRRTEDSLRRSEAWFRNIYEQVPAGIAIESPDLRFVHGNPAFCRIVGYPEEELRDLTVADLLCPAYREADRENREKLRRGEIDAFRMEKEYATKSGGVAWASTTISAVRDREGRLTYFLAIVEDVTERRRMEAELRRTTEELERYFNVALDLFCIADMEGRFLYLNPEWERTLGYRLDELKSMSYFDLIHPDDLAATRAAAADLAAQKKVANFCNRYRRKDGTYRWLEWRSASSGDRIYASVRDITERKRSEDLLRLNEERLRFALEGANDGLWDIDLKTNAYYLSVRGCRILDYTPDEIHAAAKTWVELMHPDDVGPSFELLRRYVEGREPLFQMEHRLRTKNGEWKWVLSRGKVVERDPDGAPRRMVGTHSDITERKKNELELQKYREHLEELVARRTAELTQSKEELESFSYSVSHDLRAPLRAIEGFSFALLEDHAAQLDDEGKHYLQRVRKGAQHMAQLIDDILNLSRVIRSTFRQEPVDLSALADGIVGELREREPSRPVRVTVNRTPPVTGDPRLLGIALENLLGNAWKFTGKQAEARIEFGAAEKGGETVYYVKDNGAGFDMACAGRLFGAFQRMHTEQEFPGTGIGLATVQRIVRRHGGKIWAESAPDKGAAFYFTIAAPPNGGLHEGEDIAAG